MKNHTKYPALVSTILLSVALFATPAHADTDTTTQRESASADIPVAAPATAKLNYARTEVTTTAAIEIVPVSEPVYQEAAPEIVPEKATNSPTQTLASPKPTATATPKAEKAPLVSASGKGAAIAAAAYAQLGIAQDCTALATNSLSAVGIHFHGWPAEYLALGRVVPASEAQAGDLAYYPNGGMGVAHIAVYVGNGMAVHGGWNGGTTALFSVNVGSGPVFIRVA